MARPQSTPPASTPEEEVVTPLQKLLVGSFLWALILVPLSGFVIYLSPIHKAFPSIERGNFFVIGALLGIALAFAISFLWMTVVPKMLVRRDEKKALARKQQREERRSSSRKAREEE